MYVCSSFSVSVCLSFSTLCLKVCKSDSVRLSVIDIKLKFRQHFRFIWVSLGSFVFVWVLLCSFVSVLVRLGSFEVHLGSFG